MRGGVTNWFVQRRREPATANYCVYVIFQYLETFTVGVGGPFPDPDSPSQQRILCS